MDYNQTVKRARSQDDVTPKLKPAGTGLPLFERLVASYLFLPVKARQTTWEQSNRVFTHETAKILRLTRSLSIEQMQTPILIPKIVGIEDNSRFWSPVMVMEHLMIVAPAMADAIVRLSCGESPEVKVDISAYKPARSFSNSADLESVRSAFESLMEHVHNRVTREVRDRQSHARLHHPWFGPLTARHWNWLLGSHQWVHRKQIEAMDHTMGVVGVARLQ